VTILGSRALGEAWQALIAPLPRLWPLLLIAVAVYWLRHGPRRLWRRTLAGGLARVDTLDGSEFEAFLADLFRRLGHRVEPTGGSGDFGCDLVVTRADGLRTAVQAKRSSGSVGVEAVQQVAAARTYWQCQHALVVTNAGFTPAAIELATACAVELWDRAALAAALNTRR
jgi:HJR/Mrr/RecB family endonuclease